MKHKHVINWLMTFIPPVFILFAGFAVNGIAASSQSGGIDEPFPHPSLNDGLQQESIDSGSWITPNMTLKPRSQAIQATGLESPDFRVLSFRIRDIGENHFCLTEELIRSRVELRLMQQGITPFTEQLNSEFPQLEVTVTLSENSFSMHLDLLRNSIFTIGNTIYEKEAIMWNEEILGLHDHDLEIIFDSLDYLLSRFISSYLLSNQYSME